MACPILKTLRISFTPSNPAPDNGYRVKWRVVGTPTYTTVTQVFTTSPITLVNIPACDNVEGTIESICGSVYSTVVNFSATKEQSFVCGNNITGGQLSAQYMTYPQRLIDTQGSGDAVTITYNANDVPNRFTIYNSDNGLVQSSAWIGTAAYPGPWGASLSTLPSGFFTFNKSTSGGDLRYYYLLVEQAGSAVLGDSWTVNISCATTPGGGGGGGGGSTPTYAVVPSTTSVNEGSSVIFTINTTNVIDPSTLYYTISGTGVDGNDFNDGLASGSFVINNQQGSVTKTLTNDLSTEGTQNFVFEVRTGSTSGPIVATSASVAINDTSVVGSPVIPSYELVATNASSEQVVTINEGNNLTIRLNTTNVANGTNIPYTVTGINSGDIAGNSDTLTGNFTVSGNTAVKNFYIEADQTTEGTENFVLSLNGLDKSISVAIVDSSPAPSWTGYNLHPVLDDAECTSNGADITAYKLNDSGAILSNDVLYSAQNVNSKLASGTYGDGTYKYTVQSNGIVSNKTTCGTGSNPESVYNLSVNTPTATEGSTVTFTLSTTNVSLGEMVYYTVTGISAGDVTGASLTGFFTAGETTTKQFTIVNDFSAEGTETMTMTLDGKGISANVVISDTSTGVGAGTQILIEDNDLGQTPITCLGGNYNQVNHETVVTVKDADGNTVNAASTITVTVRYTSVDCLNNTTTIDHDFVINAGSSSASWNYIYSTIVDCGQSNCEPENITIECAQSIPGGYTLRAGSAVSACGGV